MDNKKLLLFIGDDYVSLLFYNHFIPQLIKMNVEPIIINVDNGHSHDDKNLELKRYDFYQKHLLQDVLIPFIENSNNDEFRLKTPNQIISQYNITTHNTSKVNDAETSEFIKSIDIIGAISVRCFQIFKPKLISLIKEKGFFVIHTLEFYPITEGYIVCCAV